MPSYKVKCAMCGISFLAKTRNEKYCSLLCRADGAKQIRNARERSDSYKIKRNERMQKKRQEEQRALEEKRKAQRSKALSNSKKEDVARKKKHDQEIQEKAKQGDLNALQELALGRGDTLEYWRLYKEKILKSEKEFNYIGRNLVGGIDVHEENFEYLVIEQLKYNKEEKRL